MILRIAAHRMVSGAAQEPQLDDVVVVREGAGGEAFQLRQSAACNGGRRHGVAAPAAAARRDASGGVPPKEVQ